MFRNGLLSGELTDSNRSSNVYDEVKNHQISFPVRTLQKDENEPEAIFNIKSGTNTITIGIMAPSESGQNYEVIFDCGLCLMSMESESRIFDYTYNNDIISTETTIHFLSHNCNSFTSSSWCKNSISIKFTNDRRERINSIILTLGTGQENEQPHSFILKAHTENEE